MTAVPPPELAKKIAEIIAKSGMPVRSGLVCVALAFPLIAEHQMKQDTEVCRQLALECVRHIECAEAIERAFKEGK